MSIVEYFNNKVVEGKVELKEQDRFLAYFKLIKDVDLNVTIVGDYDVDGIMSTTIAVRVLRSLFPHWVVNFVLPHREEEGFGLSNKLIDRMLKTYPDTRLVMTVDNGSLAVDAVEYANSLGLSVIITDHHLGEEVEPDTLVINPNRFGENKSEGFTDICGTAVIYELMLALAQTIDPNKVKMVESFKDLVGMATLADVMPLVNINREYVKHAIQSLNTRPRFVFKAILEQLVISKRLDKKAVIDEEVIGFNINPIFNAQNRLGQSAESCVDLFLSTDTLEIKREISRLMNDNEKRKEISNQAFENALNQNFDSRGIVYIDNSILSGICGLVAGKLAEATFKPSIVFTKVDDTFKGSARSNGKVNIYDVLASMNRDLFIKFGGHEGAAGLTVKAESIDLFISEFNQKLDLLDNQLFIRDNQFDFVVDEVTVDLVNEIKQFAPFGHGWEKPTIKTTLNPTDCNKIGSDKNHMKLSTSQNIDVLVWNVSDSLFNKCQNSNTITLVGQPSLNTFLGKTSLQMIVTEKDFI